MKLSFILFLSTINSSLGFSSHRHKAGVVANKCTCRRETKATTTTTTTTTSLFSTKTRSWASSATTITGKWRQNYEALKTFAEQYGHTRIPYNYPPNPRLGRWVHRQRTLYKDMLAEENPSSSTSNTMKKVRPATFLTKERIEALKSIGFSFESPRKRTWNKRFDELGQYRAFFGDCLVPLRYEDIPGLGGWVRNQRTQYRNLLMGRKQSSTLTPERIAALQSIGFVWDTQRNDQWKKRFDELVDFKFVFGHCSVPEKFHENPQLGAWVANQRTSYKNFFAGNTGFASMITANDDEGHFIGNSAKGLTKEKIAALESIGFCWDQTTYNWYSMYERLKQYKKEMMQQYESQSQDVGALSSQSFSITLSSKDEDGIISQHEFFRVPPEDVANRDLRLWVAVQRQEYSNFMQNKNSSGDANKRSSMTPRRKRALDAISFPWSVNKQKYAEGPTVDDWTKLFEQMRERGIDKDAKPKEHWFEGQNLFGTQEDEWAADKDEWADDNLLDLWNMEDDN